MTPTNPIAHPYRDQLTHWARALASARGDEVLSGLADGSSRLGVELFLESCAGKRYGSLVKGTALVAGAFQDFRAILMEYLRDVPLAAYNPNTGDGRHFLEWLQRTRDLTDEQEDFVACQWAAHAIAGEARKNRRGYLHFQELSSLAGELAGELESNASLRIVLNPIRLWSQFRTSVLLEGAGEPPIEVLFFASGTEVGTAVLEPPGPGIIRELASCSPCTLDQWAWHSEQADRNELAAFCRNLAQMGLVAFQ